MNELQHGTISRYSSPRYKCRCDDCRKAMTDYQRSRRNALPDVVEKNRRKVAERREKLAKLNRKLKEGKPCTDCGIIYPFFVMQFDHLDGSDKVTTVSRLWSEKTIIEEASKCELVCANCHAIRTYVRSHPEYVIDNTISIDKTP